MILAVFSVIYKYTWDIMMDWALFKIDFKNKKILIKQKRL